MDWKLKVGDELVPGRLIQEPLGGGIRYQAFLTWNEDLLAPTVVKILRPDLVDDPGSRRSIAREGRLLREIDHPYFMRLLGEDTDGEKPFIELEYLDGPRLSTLLRRHGVFVGDQLYPLGRQLAAAVHYLHKQELLHLDVKPKNIIMGPVPRLIDLSIARPLDRAMKSKGPLGTDAYMAPEQCGPEGFGPMGSPADVWGLGATLHHCISGHRPFPRPEGARDSDDPEVRFPQLGSEPEPLGRPLPQGLEGLVSEMLRKDQEGRPTAAEVADRLAPFVSDLPSKLSFRGRIAG